MDADYASERARAKAEQLLESLDLTPHERETVHDLYVSILGAVIKNRRFWQTVEDGSIKPEVIPAAAAMLTAYCDELVRAIRERGQPRREI
jgi:hypothetical protein